MLNTLTKNFQSLSVLNKPSLGHFHLQTYHKQQRQFGKQSRRQYTPRIIRSGRFTRHGMMKKAPANPPQYDLDRPDIEKPHLYYDKKVDSKIEKKKYLERRKIRRDEEDMDDTSQKAIVTDLKNENIYHRGIFLL